METQIMFAFPRRAAALVCAAAGLWTPFAVAEDVPSVPPATAAVGCATGHCKAGKTHADRCIERKAIWHDIKACCKTPAIVLPPHGTYTRNAFEMQRQNALGEYFTVYFEDFLLSTATLNESGMRHLAGIARRMNETGAPVKVEPAGPGLDEKRKQAVIEALIRLGADPQAVVARVVTGGTRAEGLRYDEIDRIGQRVIVGPGLGSIGGGFGGGGGSGGAR